MCIYIKSQCSNWPGPGNKADEAKKLRLILTGLEIDGNKQHEVHEGGEDARSGRVHANLLVHGKDVARENVGGNF